MMSVIMLPVTLMYLALRAMGELLWSVLGNDDDPQPPTTWRPEWSGWRRLLVWYVTRNPLHNLLFYRLGVKGRGWLVTGRFSRPGGAEMWPPAPYRVAWCTHTHPRCAWLRLPFVSWRLPIGARGIEGYIGWRPSGALGGSLRVKESKSA